MKTCHTGRLALSRFSSRISLAKWWSIQSEVESKQRIPFAVANGCSYCRSLQIPNGSNHIATCTSMIKLLNVSHTSNPASDASILVETWILRTDRKAIYGKGIKPYPNLRSSYQSDCYPFEGLWMLRQSSSLPDFIHGCVRRGQKAG